MYFTQDTAVSVSCICNFSPAMSIDDDQLTA